MMNGAVLATLALCVAVTAGIVVRPFRLPEAVWAALGASILAVTGLLPLSEVGKGVIRGKDVYGFLIGMMLLSEVARREGVFDWIAVNAVNHARGSPVRLFALVYVAGVIVTTFLSNDATAVVMTPAVYAVAKRAGARPLPLLFCCVTVANAASFVLPISNPANLVFFNGAMPLLSVWLASFGLPALGAVLAGYSGLYIIFRRTLAESESESNVPQEPLSTGGRTALCALILTAFGLVTVSALDLPLGLPTLIAGLASMGLVSAITGTSPLSFLKHVSWSAILLVAGLFVLVQALGHIGAVAAIADLLCRGAQANTPATAMISAVLLALISNVTNNLPAGLIAGTAALQAQPPQLISDALLIGGDLGPSLAITGSLASLLWLNAIRREGEEVTFGAFLRVGLVVMPAMLSVALGLRLALG
ncbi:Arsenical pump membrane protein [Granulibacter bethesdensis]|uniref:Arsenical pump membrane protein n=2 Tax=Granulibacter bethesdensis TaxID=364410 RepID=A0AAN0RFL3_9PROT|nr:Arsenical pump membrane protein [Granulibacter bethesdensis]